MVVGCVQGNSGDEYDVVVVGGGMVGAAVACGIGMYLVTEQLCLCVLLAVLCCGSSTIRSFSILCLGFQGTVENNFSSLSNVSGTWWYDVRAAASSLTIVYVGIVVAANSPLSRDLRVAIVDSAKSMASPKHVSNAVPDQRVSAITPATVRFLKGMLSLF